MDDYALMNLLNVKELCEKIDQIISESPRITLGHLRDQVNRTLEEKEINVESIKEVLLNNYSISPHKLDLYAEFVLQAKDFLTLSKPQFDGDAAKDDQFIAFYNRFARSLRMFVCACLPNRFNSAVIVSNLLDMSVLLNFPLQKVSTFKDSTTSTDPKTTVVKSYKILSYQTETPDIQVNIFNDITIDEFANTDLPATELYTNRTIHNEEDVIHALHPFVESFRRFHKLRAEYHPQSHLFRQKNDGTYKPIVIQPDESILNQHNTILEYKNLSLKGFPNKDKLALHSHIIKQMLNYLASFGSSTGYVLSGHDLVWMDMQMKGQYSAILEACWFNNSTGINIGTALFCISKQKPTNVTRIKVNFDEDIMKQLAESGARMGTQSNTPNIQGNESMEVARNEAREHVPEVVTTGAMEDEEPKLDSEPVTTSEINMTMTEENESSIQSSSAFHTIDRSPTRHSKLRMFSKNYWQEKSKFQTKGKP